MSNHAVYDPLLVHYLAAELDERLRGRGCTAAPFFAPDLSVVLPFDRGTQLTAELHPRRGWVTLSDSDGSDAGEELDAICTGVSAPPDERILRIGLHVTGRFREQHRTLVIELPTNQWNAILIDQDERIVNVLRGRRAGSRSIFPGSEYLPPPATGRFGVGEVDRGAAEAMWAKEVEAAPEEERRSRLIRSFAWTGSANAGWILSARTGSERFGRWWWLRSLPDPSPCAARLAGSSLAYPVRLEGVKSEPFPSLLAATESVAAVEAGPGEERSEDVSAAESLVRRRLATTVRKLESLRAELAAAGEGEGLRSLGDLLLAKIHEVPRGQSSVRLQDWEGREVEITLDPTLSPADNAAGYYDEARRRERAEARLPGLIAQAEKEQARLEGSLRDAAEGRVPEWVAEALRRRVDRRASDSSREPLLPYRIFRTSGGLEVRVGRGAKENDRLTFRESSPNDVWLHARSVPGSHVILRWPDAEGAPPARDLAEAAQLAALFSRARSSGIVPVDWTRRKHVRKPRGAAPGLVIPQRVKTIFVEPDERVVERLS